jgi:hypothetical protein
MPKTADENWAAAKQDLAGAAARAGVDAGVIARVAGFESQYSSVARPISTIHPKESNTVEQFDGVMAMSSAYGYGQFTDATWIDMVHQHGEKYGVVVLQSYPTLRRTLQTCEQIRYFKRACWRS